MFAWFSWAKIAGFLTAVLGVIAGLFLFHRKGVADGRAEERGKQANENREALARAIEMDREEDEIDIEILDAQEARALDASLRHAKVELARDKALDKAGITDADLDRWEEYLKDLDREWPKH